MQWRKKGRTFLRILFSLAAVAPTIVVIVFSYKFYDLGNGGLVPIQEIKGLRYALSFAWMMASLKTLDFFRLSEDAAQFIDLVTTLLDRIMPILPILVGFITSFSIAFWLIGQNQIDFEIATEMDKLKNDVGLYHHAMPDK